MKRALTLIVVFWSFGAADRALAGAPELPKCPVMGEPIDFSVSTDTDEGPVYFCCKRCAGKFTANPSEFAKSVAEQRKALAEMPKVQVTCPVSGKPIDKKTFVEINGETYYTCCKGCIPKLQGEFDKYKDKLASCYTYQAKCPVMGGDINPGVFMQLKTGEKVYFCCPRCIKPFEGNPAQFAANLTSQGFGALAKQATDEKTE